MRTIKKIIIQNEMTVFGCTLPKNSELTVTKDVKEEEHILLELKVGMGITRIAIYPSIYGTTIEKFMLEVAANNDTEQTDNGDPSFMLFSTISNVQKYVSIYESTISGIRFVKKGNGFEITYPATREKLNIPYSHFRDFIMVALESYCHFSPVFKNKIVDINLNVTSHEEKN